MLLRAESPPHAASVNGYAGLSALDYHDGAWPWALPKAGIGWAVGPEY
jgi:hypothetical protein